MKTAKDEQMKPAKDARTRIGALVLLLAVLSFTAAISAFQSGARDPWYGRSSKPKDFVAPRLPWNTFSVELPKDWQMTPGFSGFLVSSAEKIKGNGTTGGAVLVEQMALVEPLSNNDINADLAQLELDSIIRPREPGGSDFKPQVKEAGGRRFVFIQYTRPGLSGSDVVTVYGFPAGRIMYRVICIAPAARIAVYQPLFAHVAASFQPVERNNP
jgi:hypothetical protein